jgi:hypothetical protein
MFLDALSLDIYAGVYSRMILSSYISGFSLLNKSDLTDLGGPPGVVGACDGVLLTVEWCRRTSTRRNRTLRKRGEIAFEYSSAILIYL